MPTFQHKHTTWHVTHKSKSHINRSHALFVNSRHQRMRSQKFSQTLALKRSTQQYATSRVVWDTVELARKQTAHSHAHLAKNQPFSRTLGRAGEQTAHSHAHPAKSQKISRTLERAAWSSLQQPPASTCLPAPSRCGSDNVVVVDADGDGEGLPVKRETGRGGGRWSEAPHEALTCTHSAHTQARGGWW